MSHKKCCCEKNTEISSICKDQIILWKMLSIFMSKTKAKIQDSSKLKGHLGQQLLAWLLMYM